MENTKAAEILERLLDGIDPETGEILPENHLCLRPQTMRAMFTALIALRNAAPPDRPQAWANENGRLNAARPWTQADDEMLKRLHRDGMHIDDICAMMQRRQRGVQKRLAYFEHGATHLPENVGARWSKQEEEQLLKLFSENRTYAQIAAALKRNPGGVISRLQKLGVIEVDQQRENGAYKPSRHVSPV